MLKPFQWVVMPESYSTHLHLYIISYLSLYEICVVFICDCCFRECFGKKLELIHTLVKSREKNLLPCELIVTLFYMPLQHLHGYNRLLLKLANCFDVVKITVLVVLYAL